MRFLSAKEHVDQSCRYLSLAVNYVFVDKNRTACGEKTRQKEANPHQIDVPCKRFLNCYRFRFKFEKYCFEDRQAAIFFLWRIVYLNEQAALTTF